MSESTRVADHEVVITRIFDAPRDRVFAAWTDPGAVADWFGPAHMTTQGVQIDLRVGGRYELTMTRPDGGAFAVGYDIIELEPPALLVLRSDPMPEHGMAEPTVVRVDLHDHGEKTRMTLTDGPMPGAEHAAAGWNAAFDKLAARLT
jgi:uncharacterized protein YndB with AHSA1/START domain